ncbi:hypothetical protein EYC84_002542 [Monilinia fructicola]|uniref:VIT domain-containing protein n=2 Tax=Monilinia fructicola TaxID=38448 RepID=A0A5M9JQY1_MONFR|nr:hypothetical protein EYC84_002542 [Monilinia fructicola]
MAHYGISYKLNQEPYARNLPLVSTSIHTTIKATALHTVLIQVFDNRSKENIPSCNYQFPLYDGISIIKFTCTIGNRKLSGVVREKASAKKIYDEAKNRGETAGILEQNAQASDVFSTSLGNIPGGQNVVVEIEYIGELRMEGGDLVKLVIPTKVAPRYGWAGTSSAGPGVTTKGGMKITVDILMWKSMRIDGLTSPSHPIAVTIGALSSASGNRDVNMASATLAQESAALKQDFILLLNVKDLGNPKAMLETHSTISNHRALMVSLVPKFTLPAHHPEIVFVVDRSGSMENNMVTLNLTMKFLLKSLPMGTHFNICSFGTNCNFLWPKSKQSTSDSLEEALQRVKNFQAVLGSTNILKALTATIENRFTNMPLEIILITDGEIWQQSGCFEYLNDEVKKSQGAIRVFPLGIGINSSHALINGIARAGNGFPQNVRAESMERNVTRMLRGALYPHITDYTMEIEYESEESDDGDDIERVTDSMRLLLSDMGERIEELDQNQLPAISLFNPTVEDVGDACALINNALPKPLPYIPIPKLLQAPYKIPSLFPGINTVVYLLMSPETIKRNPTAVVLRGTSANGPVELYIPIEILPVPANTIHELAVRKVTQDLEEGRGWIYNAKDGNGGYLKDRYSSQIAEIVKREAVRLGKQFQIANRWCSFVAVIEDSAESTEKEEFQQFDFFVTGNAQSSEYEAQSNERMRQEPAAQNPQPPGYQAQFKRMTRPADSENYEMATSRMAVRPRTRAIRLASTAIKKDCTTALSAERILKIIDFQQSDGTWINLSGIERVLCFKVPQDVYDVKSNATARKLWITLIVLSVLEHTMNRKADIVGLVVVKAKAWLNSMEANSVQAIEEMKKAAMEIVMKANINAGSKALMNGSA